MKGNIVYVTTMYRWADTERHSYVLGAYTTKTKAIKAGEQEREDRGGTKYYPKVIEVALDKPELKYRIVLDLPGEHPFMRKVGEK